jgi:hypothetical protein
MGEDGAAVHLQAEAAGRPPGRRGRARAGVRCGDGHHRRRPAAAHRRALGPRRPAGGGGGRRRRGQPGHGAPLRPGVAEGLGRLPAAARPHPADRGAPAMAHGGAGLGAGHRGGVRRAEAEPGHTVVRGPHLRLHRRHQPPCSVAACWWAATLPEAGGSGPGRACRPGGGRWARRRPASGARAVGARPGGEGFVVAWGLLRYLYGSAHREVGWRATRGRWRSGRRGWSTWRPGRSWRAAGCWCGASASRRCCTPGGRCPRRSRSSTCPGTRCCRG